MATAPEFALAADWEIVYKSDSQVTLSDNILGSSSDKIVGFKTNTTHSVDILAKTKVDLFRLTPTLNTIDSFYKGNGFDPQYFPGLSADYSRTFKRTTIGANAFFKYAEASSADSFFDPRLPFIPPTTLFDESGERFDSGAGVSLTHKLTKRDSLSWTANYSRLRYSGISTLEPNDTIATNMSWRREWTKLYTSSLALSISREEAGEFRRVRRTPRGRPIFDNRGRPIFEDVASSVRWLIDPTLSVEAKLTKRLSASANVGMSFINPEDAETSANFIYGLNATYTLKNNTFTGGFGRTVSVGNDGRNQDRYNFNVGVTHVVNDLTSVGMNANYVFSPKVGPDSTALFISPFINYKPAKNWNTSLSYQFSQENSDDEKTTENAVVLKVSYDKTILP